MRSSEREIQAAEYEGGAVAVEYALLLTCVFLAVFATVVAIGLTVATFYNSIVSLFTS